MNKPIKYLTIDPSEWEDLDQVSVCCGASPFLEIDGLEQYIVCSHCSEPLPDSWDLKYDDPLDEYHSYLEHRYEANKEA